MAPKNAHGKKRQRNQVVFIEEEEEIRITEVNEGQGQALRRSTRERVNRQTTESTFNGEEEEAVEIDVTVEVTEERNETKKALKSKKSSADSDGEAEGEEREAPRRRGRWQRYEDDPDSIKRFARVRERKVRESGAMPKSPTSRSKILDTPQRKRRRAGLLSDTSFTVLPLTDIVMNMLSDHAMELPSLVELPFFLRQRLLLRFARRGTLNDATALLFVGDQDEVVEVNDCSTLSESTLCGLVEGNMTLKRLRLRSAARASSSFALTLARVIDAGNEQSGCLDDTNEEQTPGVVELSLHGAYLFSNEDLSLILRSASNLRELELEWAPLIGTGETASEDRLFTQHVTGAPEPSTRAGAAVDDEENNISRITPMAYMRRTRRHGGSAEETVATPSQAAENGDERNDEENGDVERSTAESNNSDEIDDNATNDGSNRSTRGTGQNYAESFARIAEGRGSTKFKKMVMTTTEALEGPVSIGKSELAPSIGACSRLERLSIRHCPGVSRDDLLNLPTLRHLRHLSIHGMVRIDDTALVHFLKKNGGDLRSLDVGLCRSLTKASLLRIASLCPHLTRLSFSGLTDAVDDEVLETLTGLALEIVHLRACKRIEGRGLQALKMRSLRQISLHSVESLSQADLLDLLTSPAIGCVEALDLSWIRSITDELLLKLMDYCTSLSLCLLWGCMTVSDEVMNRVREIARKKGRKCRVFGGNSGQRVDAASLEMNSSYQSLDSAFSSSRRLEREWSLLLS